MLNAGLVPLAIVDKHIADFWKQVFPNLTVHDDIAIHTGGEIAWAIRKNTPRNSKSKCWMAWRQATRSRECRQ